MGATIVSQEIDRNRRRFFGGAAMSIVAAAQLDMVGSANAQSGETKLPAIKPGTNTSFGPLKQIDAGLLSVGYAEAGPAGGPAVILLHGWPYDIHSFVEVAPLLASGGYRVIVPYGQAHTICPATVAQQLADEHSQQPLAGTYFVQTPARQTWLAAHAVEPLVPQAPQWVGSVWTFTHASFPRVPWQAM